jgi:hypothetical protein
MEYFVFVGRPIGLLASVTVLTCATAWQLATLQNYKASNSCTTTTSSSTTVHKANNNSAPKPEPKAPLDRLCSRLIFQQLLLLLDLRDTLAVLLLEVLLLLLLQRCLLIVRLLQQLPLPGSVRVGRRRICSSSTSEAIICQ